MASADAAAGTTQRTAAAAAALLAMLTLRARTRRTLPWPEDALQTEVT